MTEVVHEWNPDEGDLCQGDVLLFRLPDGFHNLDRSRPTAPRDGNLILAEGEVTGHNHAIHVNQRTIDAQIETAALRCDDGMDRRVVNAGHLTERGSVGLVEDARILLFHLARALEAQIHSTALYRDDVLVRRLVDDGHLTDGSLCVGFLAVEDEPVLLRHQEHDAVRIPPGLYYVGRQREFWKDAARQVAD